MFAVIKTGGKQYNVAADNTITVMSLAGEPGDKVTFEVLMLGGDEPKFGTPFIAGASVTGEIVAHERGPKVIAFKKRRRQNSKRKRGFRAELTVIRITDILTGGKKPEMKKGEASPVALTAASSETKGKAAAKPAKAVAKADAPALDASNLSLISGVGPTIEKKLRAAGIASWNDIAAWSDEDVTKWDEELKLRGRAAREEWVEQAKELLAGKPPRAKADQAELASGEDY